MWETIVQATPVVTGSISTIVGAVRVLLGNSAADRLARRTRTLSDLHTALPDRFARDLEDELREHVRATGNAFKRSRSRRVDATNLFMVVVFGVMAGGAVWLGFHFDTVLSITIGAVVGAALALFTAVGAGQTITYDASNDADKATKTRAKRPT